MSLQPFQARAWILSTTLGWLLGFVLVLLLAVALEAIGGGAQFIVGTGMGAGVGLLQFRVLRRWVGHPQPWIWMSTVGMGVPHLLWDLGAAIGITDLFSLPKCVLLGGLLTGALQCTVLRAEFRRAWWWIPASVAGWGLPAGLIAAGDLGLLTGPWRFLPIGAILLGGLLLGIVTGWALQWISALPSEPHGPESAA